MNKIIRFASVIAVVCASLVYAGCTKDFSSDIARLEDEKATKVDVKAVNDALEAFKTEATAQLNDIVAKKADKSVVDAIQSQLDKITPIANANKADIAAIQTQIAAAQTMIEGVITQTAADIAGLKDAAKTIEGKLTTLAQTVQENDTKLEEKIKALDNATTTALNTLKADYEKLDADQQKLIDALTGKVDALEKAVKGVEDAIAVLQSQMTQVLGMVQSLSFIPDVKGNAPVAYTFVKEVVEAPTAANAPIAAKAVFEATLQVTPAKAAANITADALTIRVIGEKEGVKALAMDPIDTLITVTKVKVRENGLVDFIGAFDYSGINDNVTADDVLNVVAIYAQDGKDGFEENISTSIFPIVIDDDPTTIEHVFGKDGQTDDKFVCDTIIVTPKTAEADLKRAIFGEENKYEVYAQARLGTEDTLVAPLAELAALIGADVDFVSPKVGDTVFTGPEAIKPFIVDTNFFATKVAPDTTVLAILKESGNKEVKYQATISICGGISKVVATYIIKPEEVKEDLGVLETIDWDWKLANTPLKTGITIKGIKTDLDKYLEVGKYIGSYGISIANKASGTPYNDNTNILWIEDSKTIKADIASANIKYGKVDSTYVCTFANKEIPGTIYTLSFDFVVKARPADIEIKLPAVDTVVSSIKSDFEIDNDVLAQVVKKLVALTDEENKEAADTSDLEYKIKGAFEPEESTCICGIKTRIEADSLKYGEITLKNTFETVFGIKVTATQNIKFSTPALTLAPIKEYVAGTGKHDYSVEVKANILGGKYVVNNMPFQQYLKVAGNTKEYVAYAKLNAPKKVTVPANPVGLASKKEGIFDNNIIEWGTLDTLAFNLGVALTNADKDVVLDTATIKFYTKDPITFTAKDTAVVQKIGSATEVNLFDALTLKGIGTEGNLINSTGLVKAVDYGQKELKFEIKQFSSDDAKKFAKIDGNKFVLSQNHGILTAPATFIIKASVKYIFGTKTVEFPVIVKPVE